MKKLSLLSLGILLAAGCSFGTFGKGEAVNDQNRTDLEERRKLEETFNAVRGHYVGHLLDAGQMVPVELFIYITEERAGSKPNGEPNIIPVLYSRLRTSEIVRFDVTLNTRFFPETGQLLLSNPNPGSETDIKSLTARLIGSEIQGSLSSVKGEIGPVNLRLSSRESRGPGQDGGGINDRNLRLCQQYAALAGDYSGIVSPDPREAAPFRISVRLFVASQNTERGLEPRLLGFYRFGSAKDSFLDLSLQGNLKNEFNPPLIVLNSLPTRDQGRFVVLEVRFDGQRLVGRHTDQRGQVAQVSLARANTLPVDCTLFRP
ncbi:MAG: hypothetical protein N2578_03410 [Bdellovibrionaceae bacterium]|nr:hypothetical protein [Pseudobdellovibrionaceae bacterium]